MGQWSVKILTIAIPTYNRAEILEQQLEKLLLLIDENCTILISDNASSDETENIVKAFLARSDQITYNRNPINLGFDANILKCIELSKTEFVWTLSDDDEIIENSIKDVISCILTTNPNVICLNDGNKKGKVTLNQIEILENVKLDCRPGEPISTKEMNEEIRLSCIIPFVWISRMVINKSKLELDNYKPFIGSKLIHLAMVNSILQNKDSIIVFTNTPIIINKPHCVYTKLYYDVNTHLVYDFCKVLQSNFSDILCLKIQSEYIKIFIQGIKDQKKGYTIWKFEFHFIEVIKLMLKYKVHLFYILKLTLFYFIPTFVFKVFGKKKRLCKDQSKISHI